MRHRFIILCSMISLEKKGQKSTHICMIIFKSQKRKYTATLKPITMQNYVNVVSKWQWDTGRMLDFSFSTSY